MKRTTRSTKGQNLTSDYLPYETVMAKGRTLLKDPKKAVIGLYIITSVNTGLRVSDVIALTHGDLQGKRPGDTLRVHERKTGKAREIQLNLKVLEAYRDFLFIRQPYGPFNTEDLIFKSQKNLPYATPSLNVILKKEFAGFATNISTHSLRKSFGRHVWDLNQQSEAALIKLSQIFNHADLSVTRTYLGITREEIADIYMNL